MRDAASQAPDRLAFRFLGATDDDAEELSFGAFEQRVRAIAAHLRERTRPGDRVLVLCPPGLDYVAALFACFYAGVTAVPAFPPQSFPFATERLARMIEDSAVAVAIVTPGVRDVLPAVAETRESLSKLPLVATDVTDTDGAGLDPSTRGGDQAAVLLYTSGTTGDPRGVMLTHENVLASCRRLGDLTPGVTGHRVVSWLPPHHHMGLLGGVLTPALVGGSSTLMNPLSFFADPQRWLDAITRYRAVVSLAPDYAYALCARKITDERRRRLSLRTWEVALIGGERVRPQTLRAFADRFSAQGFSRRAWRPFYGLTEASFCVSMPSGSRPPLIASVSREALELGDAHEAEPGPAAAEHVAVGTPVSGTRVRIADPGTGRALPSGRVGEIWVASPTNAAGYYGRPAETTAAFRNHLLLSDGQSYLRTGDLGFLDGDNELFVVGRVSETITIRGRSYYPDDIEDTAGRAHPALRTGWGAAFGVGPVGETRLAVVQEVRDAAHAQSGTIGSAIREAIAREYRLPVHTLVLTPPGTIPRTATGKINRRQARAKMIVGALGGTVSSLSASGTYPRGTGEFPALADQLETKVAACMAKHLGLDSVALDADFFALGGHTRLATGVIAELRETLEVDLPWRTLFDAPTARELAAAIRSVETTLSVPPIPRIARGRPLPMSYAQERMLFVQLLNRRSSALNLAGAVQLDGPIDADALVEVIRALPLRHEILRAKYELTTRGVLQTARPRAELPVERLDVSDAPNPETVSDLHSRVMKRKPFDLGHDLLIRAAVHRLRPESHRVVLCAHHIVADALSLDIALEQIVEAYAARRNGSSALPSPADLQYVDYAAWQRRFLQSEAIAAQLGYWRERLADAPRLLPLPTDRRREPKPAFDTDRVRIGIGANLVDALRELGQSQGATLFMVILAALKAVLSRHAGVTDISVGTPIPNRSWRASEGLIGNFVNMLVMRTDCSGDPTFVELIARVREVCLGAYDHRDVPFERIVEVLQPERDVSVAPLFQVLLECHTVRLRPVDDGALRPTPVPMRRTAAQYDLSFSFVDHGEGMFGTVEYRSDLFDVATVERVVHHLMNVLEAAADDPATRISRLPMLEAAEKERLLALASGPAPERQRYALVHEAIAAVSPERVAVEQGAQQLRYGELIDRADRLAARLHAFGVGPDDRVAVLLSRSPSLVVALLAVMRAGAAYIPLDPDYPPARLQMMLEDGRPSAIVTEGSLVRMVPEWDTPVVLVGEEHAPSAPFAPPALDPESIAYVMFTSGSTGRPKGVMVPHRALTNFMHAMADEPGCGPDDRVLAVTTASFDIAALELLLPLTLGARVDIAERQVAADARQLRARIDAVPPTILQATPATWRMLIEAGWVGTAGLRVLCGGEALPRDLADALLGRTDELWNLYGPTETTIWSAAHRVAPGQGDVPIGHPIRDTQLYIVGPNGGLAPQGAAGELYIGGGGVARGYLGQPTLTDERFVPDLFGGDPELRLYRTGDLVRHGTDGSLRFLGRRDAQIKLRGHRIELGEVEAHLRACPGVIEAVAAVEAPGQPEERLIAYVTAQGPIAAAALRRAAAERLPSSMVPAAIRQLDAFPRTANGKLDRRALPPLGEPEVVSEQPRASDDLEDRVAAIFREILGVDHVGPTDDFFDAGGHSLLAVRLFVKMDEELGVSLSLATLFEASTVRDLARQVELTRAGDPAHTG